MVNDEIVLAVTPIFSQNALFAYLNFPLPSMLKMKSVAFSNKSRYRSSLSRSSFSAFFNSVMSRETPMDPNTTPDSSRIILADNNEVNSLPERVMLMISPLNV